MRCEITSFSPNCGFCRWGSGIIISCTCRVFWHAQNQLQPSGLAKARNACAVPAWVLAGTPYAKVLASVLPAAGETLDYLTCEHAFETYFYATVLALIDARPLRARRSGHTRLFRIAQAEIYNLDILYRAKTFFAGQLTPDVLRKPAAIPVYGRAEPAQNMEQLGRYAGLAEFLKPVQRLPCGDMYTAHVVQARRDASQKYASNARSAPRRAG